MCCEVYVYFTYADRPYWWTHFLKPGFSHVYLVQKVDDGYLVLNPYLNGLAFKHYKNTDNLPKSLQKTAITVKTYTISVQKMSVFRPTTCVEIIKRALGLNKFFIFTPYQLYRHLLWVARQQI